LQGVFHKTSPASLDDLKSIEQHVKSLVARVSSAVVAVEVGGATGSGVVVSEDGWVLTVAHVCGEPNRDVRFFFPDGKTARGKTLGMNYEIDSGLMRITDEGRWPHVEIGVLEQTRLGDWVLALGHPGGFDPERSVVARLGRIITLTSAAIRTDCTLMAGDSGGPLFDMHGRVIGIHSRISDSTADNFHVPIRTYWETWDRLVERERWGDDKPPSRPWIGVRGVDHPEGCRLERVDENGPAFKAGIRVGDVVTKMNGRQITDSSTFLDQVSQASPGDEVTLEIKRDDQDMFLSVTVEARARRR
jgi:serine protease Do